MNLLPGGRSTVHVCVQSNKVHASAGAANHLPRLPNKTMPNVTSIIGTGPGAATIRSAVQQVVRPSPAPRPTGTPAQTAKSSLPSRLAPAPRPATAAPRR